MAISPIQDIIADIRAGKLVILVDDEERENEGDLVLAAEFVSPEAINFMARYGRGLVCLTLTEDRCAQLNLPPMVANNRAPHRTAFTVSIEAAEGVTTGISAGDRAQTVRAATRADASPRDIVQPGHIFPLMAQAGGVLVRAGHTEAGCDLTALAGLMPAAVICEILKDDGEMARMPDLVAFAREHQLKVGTIADLIHYRSRTEKLVTRVYDREIETFHGPFHLIAYTDKISAETHFALVRGQVDGAAETLVRVHEPLSAVDLLDVRSAQHSWNLNDAIAAIARNGSGVIVLLHRQESGMDLLERARTPERERSSPVTNALRTYGIGAQILKDLGVSRMRLMALPRKMPSMVGFDLEVTGYVQPGE
jgi:3,4-dihydroxy 2-butanone 4-phosphate synthase/GTP cyclohydrolase II